MTIFQAILLGIIQGLTEYLPISSTAHLRIVPALLGWLFGLAFVIGLTLGIGCSILLEPLPAIIWFVCVLVGAMGLYKDGYLKTA